MKACVYFYEKTKHTLINIGSGKDYSNKILCQFDFKINYTKQKILIKYDKSKPNGTPRKVLIYPWPNNMAGILLLI